MNVFARALTAVALTLSAAVYALSQSPAPALKEASGSIAGRVTIAGKPAANIPIVLTTDPMTAPPRRQGISGTTDAEGHFQLTHVPAGRFVVTALAPAFYSEGENSGFQGKPVTLSEGESVEDIDITLRRGGVITGRVTDAMGRPLIRHHVNLYAIDQRGQRFESYSRNSRGQETDDRGIYRIYALPPGRYVVSAGTPIREGTVGVGMGSGYYPEVFYTDSGDAAKVSEIEVTEGGEAAGIDITLGRVEKSYSVVIRTVAADSGKAVAGVRCGYGSMDPSGRYMGGSMLGPETNERGECRIDGILPGKYVALAFFLGDSALNYTYDTTPFEVADADISGIEIKLHAGASISGTIAFEGVSAQEAASYLRELNISYAMAGATYSRSYSRPQINPDGSFRLVGLQAGEARLMVTNATHQNVALLRVERDGVEQNGGVQVAAGENITGVRLVVGVGKGVIRGELKVADGVLPEGVRPMLIANILARRLGNAPSQNTRFTRSDERGRFFIDGLMPGEYEINVSLPYMRDGSGAAPISFKVTRQTVNVTNEREAQVTVTLEPQSPRSQ